MKHFILLLLVCSLSHLLNRPKPSLIRLSPQMCKVSRQNAIVVSSLFTRLLRLVRGVHRDAQHFHVPHGMFNLNLSMGIHEGGTAFIGGSGGDWPHFLKLNPDIGDGALRDMGTQQMMSVPYALYAEQAGNAGDDQDQDLQTNSKRCLFQATPKPVRGDSVLYQRHLGDNQIQWRYNECRYMLLCAEL